MTHLRPYLFFNGNCQEALKWYHQILGGNLETMLVKDAPVASSMPADKQSWVMHAALYVSDSFELYASDWIADGATTPGTSISLCLVCESAEEVKTRFAQFAQGGTVAMPLAEEFFGWFGSVTDKYGINWMLQYSPDNNR